MESETLEEVCERYRLPEDEKKEISDGINKIMLAGKKTCEHPIAILDIAPPGSGKTGLNGFACKQFGNDGTVVINSDELKPFHPKIDEIAKKYPQYYTKVTNQESNFWTDNLFDAAVAKRCNIVFEGTGRNLKLLKKMMAKMDGYRIIVRGMAVNELNCLMSIVERYEGQIDKKGWGRLVMVDHFYKAYGEMLDNIQAIEESGLADMVEVYMRSDNPSDPIKIYSSKNNEFGNARTAVIIGRNRDRANAVRYYEQNFNRTEHIGSYPEEQEVLDKIEELYNREEKIR